MIDRLRAAQYDFSEVPVRAAMAESFAADAVIHMCSPLGDLTGPDAFYDATYAPLLHAFPDLERRDYIVITGETEHGGTWIGCAGYYTGTFKAPFLDIPATGHLAHMRFHEFYRMEGGKIVEVQAIWDIPELMMQARAWPMAPSLGREGLIPAPASQDGLGPHAPREDAMQIVRDMLTHMGKHPSQGGPEVMEMDRFWDARMSWYGPAGIGTARGIQGFRNWHQIPFLTAMPDRGAYQDASQYHFFAQGNYVAVTGWPNMQLTLSEGGWMGIAPAGKAISLRSLDFWRLEGDKIRENWVLVDLLDLYAQIGVDVFARLREFNKARM
jgi:predicted ester cyclase